MGDLYMVVNPHSKAETKLNDRMDLVAKLVNEAETCIQQSVRDVDKIKALIAQMDEVGLKQWARELRKLLE